MPEKNTGFMSIALGLLAMAFAIGFFITLATVGKSGILYSFALSWEVSCALLYVSTWAPAIILVGSALAMESSEAKDGFAGAATRILAPALILAAIISIFYLVFVPGIEERKNRFESQSALFSDSLRLADSALRSGDIQGASRFLMAAGAIDPKDQSYVELDEQVKSALARASAAVASSTPEREPLPDSGVSDSVEWKAANRFYLQALEARAQGRLFDAHYLAKRSAALYSKRPEVRKLVEETWTELETIAPSKEKLGSAAYYKRKLEGYARFQEADYLEAYRLYSELAAENSSDEDVKAYLKRSAEGLSSIAFFIEEDARAFSKSDEQTFSVAYTTEGGSTTRLSAARAAMSDNAVYFRDIVVSVSGGEALLVRAPFARLHGDTLILRAVDRERPDLVWEPDYETGAGSGRGDAVGPAYALDLPFDQEEAATILRLSGDPGDVPLALLATSMDLARRFGLDIDPLLADLARTASYPFAVLMLVLLGAGLGVRFKPIERPSRAAKLLSAPLLVALSIAPLRIVAGLSDVAARALAEWAPRPFFMPAWIAFLSACVIACLLVAAGIAGSDRDSGFSRA